VSSPAHVGTLREIWRYPVKSMGGQRLQEAHVTTAGLVGDRVWTLRDEEDQRIVSGKQLPALMMCDARFVRAPDPERPRHEPPPVRITLPEGGTLDSDHPEISERLSCALGRQVSLWPLQPASNVAHYRDPRAADPERLREMMAVAPGEPLPDMSALPLSLLIELSKHATPRGTYFDAFPIHLFTTAALRALADAAPGLDLNVRRFRPNLVIETSDDARAHVERDWCGGTLAIGAVPFGMEVPTLRCVMTTRPQRGLGAEPALTRALSEHTGHHLGVYGAASGSGVIRVGDPVVVTRTRSRAGQVLAKNARALRRLILKLAAPRGSSHTTSSSA
jgi:uncharacterized protein